MKYILKRMAKKVVKRLTGSDLKQTNKMILSVPSLPNLLYGNDTTRDDADLYGC